MQHCMRSFCGLANPSLQPTEWNACSQLYTKKAQFWQVLRRHLFFLGFLLLLWDHSGKDIPVKAQRDQWQWFLLAWRCPGVLRCKHIWTNQYSWITTVACHYICLQGRQLLTWETHCQDICSPRALALAAAWIHPIA